jgi:uncharacterized repeat protein (TIGR01451 family)
VVKFNGLAAAGFTVSNNTTMTAVVPASAQTGPITVIAPAGSAASAASFVLAYHADISVTLSNTPNPVFVGSNLLYTIVVANNGPFAAGNVRVTNTLPGTVTLKTATSSQGALVTGANPITGNLGTLGVGNQATVNFLVTPALPGLITNSVSVASDIADNFPANNMATLTVTVIPVAVLSIRVATRQVQVSWPVALSNFTLESRTSLNTTDAWSNNLTLPAVSGSENVVTETNLSAAKFYRLRQ